MKKIVLFLVLAACAFCEDKPLTFPFIRLQDGRVLKNATLANFTATTVLIRSSNQAPIGIRYEALPDDVRAVAEQRRAGGPRWFAGDTSANTEAINGQVFIQTVGSSSYKFGGIEVYAFDVALLSNLENANGNPVQLPKPICQTTTDADGKFTIKVPIDRPYFIFTQAFRLMPDGGVISYEWRVPMNAVRSGRQLMLSQDFRYPQSKVSIEAQL